MENESSELPNGYGELVKAVNKVMEEVSFIEKSKTIGEGKNSYKGVSDEDVKKLIGQSMAKHGLAIFQIGIKPTTHIHRYTDNNGYQKTSVFTEVVSKYRLCHVSGETIELEGYGHGVDSQDKSAGKATTYGLKYLLLYTFLVSTGKIDDADNTHSEAVEMPKEKKAPAIPTATDKAISKACDRIMNGETDILEKMKAGFRLSEAQIQILESTLTQYKTEKAA
jgi:hypothetical protein